MQEYEKEFLKASHSTFEGNQLTNSTLTTKETLPAEEIKWINEFYKGMD